MSDTINVRIIGGSENESPASNQDNLGIKKMFLSFKGLSALTKTVIKIGTLLGLVTASKMLIKTVVNITKLLGYLLRPIGNTLASLLRPLYILFRPLAKAFNAFFRTYYKEANKAIAAGNIFLRAGMKEKAAESFGSAFIATMKPFLDLFIMGFAEVGALFVKVFFKPLEYVFLGLGKLFDFIGLDFIADVFYSISKDINTASEKLGAVIRSGVNDAIELQNKALFSAINKRYELAIKVKGVMADADKVSEDKKKEIMRDLAIIDKMPIAAANKAADFLKSESAKWATIAITTSSMVRGILQGGTPEVLTTPPSWSTFWV